MGSNSTTSNTRRIAIAQSFSVPLNRKTSVTNVVYNQGIPIPENSLWKIPIDYGRTQITQINQKFDDISDAPFEIMIIVDKNKNIIPIKYGENQINYVSSGKKSTIHVHQNAYKSMNKNTFIHNHPSGSSSFSPGDLFFISANPKEMQIRFPQKTNGIMREIAKSTINVPKNVNNNDLQSILDIASSISKTLPQNNAKIGERIYAKNNKWNSELMKEINSKSQNEFKAKIGGLMGLAAIQIWSSNLSLSPSAATYLATLSTNKFLAQKYGYNHEIFEVT